MNTRSYNYIVVLVIALLSAFATAVWAEVSLTDAKQAYESGDYATAASLFKQHYDSVTETDAESLESKAMDLLFIGKCRRGLGQYGESRTVLSQLTSDPKLDSDISAEAQYLIGCSYRDEQDLQNAVQALAKVAADHPDNGAWCSTAMLLQGDCQRQLESFASARQTYQAIISQYSSKKGICLGAKMGLVQTLMEAGRIGGNAGMWAALDKAATAYQLDSAICSYIDFLKSRYGGSNDFPDFAEAATMFEAEALDAAALDAASLSCDVVGRLAEQSYSRNNYPRALELYKTYYEKFLGCDLHEKCQATNADALLRMGQCCFKLHDYANAQTTLLQITSKYPGNTGVCVQAQNLIAESYAAEGKVQEALAAYDVVSSTFSSDKAGCANALLAKAKLQRKARMYNDCIATFQSVIDSYPDQDVAETDARRGIAGALAASKRVDEALSIITGLINDGTSSPEQKADLTYWMATIQAKAKRYAECQQTVQNILSDYGDQAAICRKAKLFVAGVVVESRDRNALETLAGLGDLSAYSHGDRSRIALWTGLAYQRVNNLAKAEESFGTVISTYGDTPTSQQAYLHRALSRTARGSYDQAMADIQMIAVPCWKAYAEGEYHLARNEPAAAIADLSQVYPAYARGEMPKDVPVGALVKVRRLYQTAGDTAKANETTEQLRQLLAE